tara:strand:+ start:134 stop:364 length:231 start_codon:yes stop_codon:yes gene_type:complete
MLPLKYQSSDLESRKELVIKIANGLKVIDKDRFPKIASTVKSGNTNKNTLLNLIITQMYSNNFDVIRSFMAVEENI